MIFSIPNRHLPWYLLVVFAGVALPAVIATLGAGLGASTSPPATSVGSDPNAAIAGIDLFYYSRLSGAGSGEPITPIPPAPAADPRIVALGDELFHDPRLSGNGKRSCASCHDIGSNGADGVAHDLTPDGQPLALNTNTVFNASLSFRQNWEGSAKSLEEQALMSLTSPAFVGNSVQHALGALLADPAIVKRFHESYNRQPDQASLFNAIATYERTLVTPDSRFDRFLRGDTAALTAEEQSGYTLFKSFGCVACHQGVNVGGNLWEPHGIFSPLASPNPRIIRVPSLRNVATTAPYFHDGSAATLNDAVTAMARAQLGRSLSAIQAKQIVAFLGTLTGCYHGRLVTSPP